ncbi:MAG: sugar phosphate nucleotidyltransferase [Defluviitaleaceae bacterium]|nr:sugar phosphate nucleotidyltransferase [Defluviitaleaceae bacterium]
MKDYTLLVLAAGMGSRFGGLKQITPVDEMDNFIIDYSIHDAVLAGFNHVVFVIKKENEADFRKTIGARTEVKVRTSYAFQDLADVPPGFTVPAERVKPWGTGHAVLAARNLITGPFATINGDDFYGREVYVEMHNQLTTLASGACVMPGYRLEATLSETGGVSRGICAEGEGGQLISVEEHHNIKKMFGQNLASAENSAGTVVTLPLDAPVSMNMWGFAPDIFADLEHAFTMHLQTLKNPEKDEFYLPGFVGDMITNSRLTAKIWHTPAKWSGITHRTDLEELTAKLAAYRAEGIYRFYSCST